MLSASRSSLWGAAAHSEESPEAARDRGLCAFLGHDSTGWTLRYHAPPRRSGRVAEGGALLRRYMGEYLCRGFESLLLRQTWRPRRGLQLGGVAERSNAAVSKTVTGR